MEITAQALPCIIPPGLAAPLILAPDEKIDWFRIIVALERAGRSQKTIARAVGVAQSTVFGWKQGATPRWDDGEALIAQWMDATANNREAVPRVKRYSHRA